MCAPWHVNSHKINKKKKKKNQSRAVLVLAFSASIREAEAGRSLSSRPAWSREFQDSWDYTENPYLEKQTNKKLCNDDFTTLYA